MEAIKGTANATISNKLKKLGFLRGFSSFEKSRFTKNMHSESEFDTTQHLTITVEIENSALWGNNWTIRRVNIQTTNLDSDFRTVKGNFSLTSAKALELVETLAAVEALKVQG